jgi:hypothetical protein
VEIDDPIPTFDALRLGREPWRQRAACRGMGFDLFFPVQPKGRPRSDRPEPTYVTVCASCPVREECGAYGAAHRYEGVWGGVLRVRLR